jgi:hypothetical protein
VHKLPLRQTEGFINSLFRLMKVSITCPDYTTLSKRFGRDEWYVEKHRVNARRSWRKAYFGIDANHIIQAATLTDRFAHDDGVINDLLGQIHDEVEHFSADGAYDETPVYDKLLAHSPAADIVIPPAKNAMFNPQANMMRNRNILEIAVYGRMAWQKERQYGQRNISELGIQRYKRILGRALHAIKFERQQQELMIGCGILNKITRLGMPESFKAT